MSDKKDKKDKKVETKQRAATIRPTTSGAKSSRQSLVPDPNLIKQLTLLAQQQGNLTPDQQIDFIYKGIEKYEATGQIQAALGRSSSSTDIKKDSTSSRSSIKDPSLFTKQTTAATTTSAPSSTVATPAKSSKKKTTVKDVDSEYEDDDDAIPTKKGGKVGGRSLYQSESKDKISPIDTYKPNVARPRSVSIGGGSSNPKRKIIKPETIKKYEERRRREALEFNETSQLMSESGSGSIDSKKNLTPKWGNKLSYENYRFINQIGKLSGSQIPEVVLIGRQGVGKSELLESIIGTPFNCVDLTDNGKTKRPLWLSLVNTDTTKDEPNVLIQSQGGRKLNPIDIKSLPAEINKINANQNGNFSHERITVHYEYKYSFNITFIDTPGLPFPPRAKDQSGSSPMDEDESDEYYQIEEFLAELIRPSHRLIIYVEEADQFQWDDTDHIREFIKKYDPSGNRTIYVFNKLRSQIDYFISPTELDNYLRSCIHPSTVGPNGCTGIYNRKCFFTTLPASKERSDAINGRTSYLDLLDRIEKRDKSNLIKLNCSSVYMDNMIGINILRDHVINWCWDSYKNREIPKILKYLDSKKTKMNSEISRTKYIKDKLNIRLLSSRFVSDYVSTAQNIINGTSRGNPSDTGETLKEEIDDQYFVSNDWELPGRVSYEDTRLYGGQQIERVINEFKAIATNLRIVNSDGSIGGSSSDYGGISRSVSSTDLLASGIDDKKFLYNSCEVIEKQVEALVVPLVEQLITRINFVMTRIPLVVDNIIGKFSTTTSTTTIQDKLLIDRKYYGPLTNYIKDIFNTYVDDLSEICKSKCLEEFYSTKTIYWDISSLELTRDVLESQDALLQFIFDRTRNRIIKNVIRKVYNLYLLPFMKADIWHDMQIHIIKMGQAELDEIFDTDTIIEDLNHDIEQLENSLDDINYQTDRLLSIFPYQFPK